MRALVHRPRSRRAPVVLCYHAFDTRPRSADPYNLFVTPERFGRQLDLLTGRGWHPLSADEYLAGLPRRNWPDRSFLITIDDGYASTGLGLQELERRGIPAVLFVPPARLGGTSAWMTTMPHEPLLSREQVRALAGTVEVGVHGLDHRELPGLTPDELLRQVRTARAELAEITGVAPRLFAYPRGLHDAAARKAVADAGYSAGFAVHRGSGRYALRRVDVLSIDSERSFGLKLGAWYPAARRAGPVLAPAWHLGRRVLRL